MALIEFGRASRVLAPSLFTLGNMACGFYSLVAVGRDEYGPAAVAILLGMVFDSLDGRVARLVRAESTFGIEFDSLSDFLSFGVAPAWMMFSFILKDYGAWGYLLAFLYALCGGLRLARFNAVAHGAGSSKTHFTGLPIPAAAGVLASFVWLYQIIEEGRPARTWKFLMSEVPSLYGLIPFATLALAFLMISTIPYPAFKDPGKLRPKSPLMILFYALLLATLVLYPQNAVFAVFAAYALSGPLGYLLRKARQILRPRPVL